MHRSGKMSLCHCKDEEAELQGLWLISVKWQKYTEAFRFWHQVLKNNKEGKERRKRKEKEREGKGRERKGRKEGRKGGKKEGKKEEKEKEREGTPFRRSLRWAFPVWWTFSMRKPSQSMCRSELWINQPASFPPSTFLSFIFPFLTSLYSVLLLDISCISRNSTWHRNSICILWWIKHLLSFYILCRSAGLSWRHRKIWYKIWSHTPMFIAALFTIIISPKGGSNPSVH